MTEKTIRLQTLKGLSEFLRNNEQKIVHCVFRVLKEEFFPEFNVRIEKFCVEFRLSSYISDNIVVCTVKKYMDFTPGTIEADRFITKEMKNIRHELKEMDEEIRFFTGSVSSPIENMCEYISIQDYAEELKLRTAKVSLSDIFDDFC